MKTIRNLPIIKFLLGSIILLVASFIINENFSFFQVHAQAASECKVVYVRKGNPQPPGAYTSFNACTATLGTKTVPSCSGMCSYGDGCDCPDFCNNPYVADLGQSCGGVAAEYLAEHQDGVKGSASSTQQCTDADGCTCSNTLTNQATTVNLGEFCLSNPQDNCYVYNNGVCGLTVTPPGLCGDLQRNGSAYGSSTDCRNANQNDASYVSCYIRQNGNCVGANKSVCDNTGTTYESLVQCGGPRSGTTTVGSGGSSSQTLSNDGSAAGSGSCAACLGLGGQAERDCYANCSGTISTGVCTGLTAEQCIQACGGVSGGSPQICSGDQEDAGSSRAGEFLSCGSSSTGGCGQVDCLVGADKELVGFVIDNSQCSGGGGGSTQQATANNPSAPQPTLNPQLSACGQGCSADNNCADANHSCIEGICRLTSNPTSANCTEPAGTTPTPVPQPSPSPAPTLSPDLASCNEACTTSVDCADLLHSCQNSLCRLTSNPSSSNCTEPSGTTPTPVPRTEDTPLQCNDPCTSDNDCSSFNHVCHNERCRLSTNLDNVSCTEPVVYQSSSTQLGQINQQPETPATLPSAGANDFKNWLLTGISAVGIGALILLLL